LRLVKNFPNDALDILFFLWKNEIILSQMVSEREDMWKKSLFRIRGASVSTACGYYLGNSCFNGIGHAVSFAGIFLRLIAPDLASNQNSRYISVNYLVGLTACPMVCEALA